MMDSSRDHSLSFRLTIAILCFFLVASSILLLCDTRSHGQVFQNIKLNTRISSSSRPWKNLKSLKHFLDTRNNFDSPLFSFSDLDDSYGSPSSSFSSLPPFSSQAPQPSPSSSSFSSPYPPLLSPPSLPKYSPINHYPPPPPKLTQSPSPTQSPPSKHSPSPPAAYLPPPNVYPPPRSVAIGSTRPPPPPAHNKRPRSTGHWCVAKPSVPDTIIKQAMDYACGSGADCKEIQTNGPCYEPNSMLAHASYAFNSYWQNRKAAGGTCDFGGTAMLVTVDPSFGKCRFTMN